MSQLRVTPGPPSDVEPGGVVAGVVTTGAVASEVDVPAFPPPEEEAPAPEVPAELDETAGPVLVLEVVGEGGAVIGVVLVVAVEDLGAGRLATAATVNGSRVRLVGVVRGRALT